MSRTHAPSRLSEAGQAGDGDSTPRGRELAHCGRPSSRPPATDQAHVPPSTQSPVGSAGAGQPFRGQRAGLEGIPRRDVRLAMVANQPHLLRGNHRTGGPAAGRRRTEAPNRHLLVRAVHRLHERGGGFNPPQAVGVLGDAVALQPVGAGLPVPPELRLLPAPECDVHVHRPLADPLDLHDLGIQDVRREQSGPEPLKRILVRTHTRRIHVPRLPVVPGTPGR